MTDLVVWAIEQNEPYVGTFTIELFATEALGDAYLEMMYDAGKISLQELDNYSVVPLNVCKALEESESYKDCHDK